MPFWNILRHYIVELHGLPLDPGYLLQTSPPEAEVIPVRDTA